MPIYKDGDVSNTGNYRGVSLLVSGYKVLTNIMAERINDWVEKEMVLKESQAGFRRHRGTRDHLFVLNMLIDNTLKFKGGKVYIAFIDFKAAFDTVDRELMMRKIWKYGIRRKMFNLIRNIYKGTKAEIHVNGRVTEDLTANCGVRQGCALSSTLFDLFIDDIDDEWELRQQGGIGVGDIKIRALIYADDVAIIAKSAKKLGGMLRKLEKYADTNKLTVNAKKTKVMVFRNDGKTKKGEKWAFKGEAIQVVKEFKYLGFYY